LPKQQEKAKFAKNTRIRENMYIEPNLLLLNINYLKLKLNHI